MASIYDKKTFTTPAVKLQTLRNYLYQKAEQMGVMENELFVDHEVPKSQQEIQAIQAHLGIVLNELVPDIQAILGAAINTETASVMHVQV